MIRIAEAMFFIGIIAQGWGIYSELGVGWMSVIVGTEISVIGLIGVLRAG